MNRRVTVKELTKIIRNVRNSLGKVFKNVLDIIP